MTRARSALRIVLSGILVLSLLPPPVAGASRGGTAFDDSSLGELRRLRAAADGAPPGERRQRWFDVGIYALRGSVADTITEDRRREVEKNLSEAVSRLPLSDLAALSARGTHPRLSQAIDKAVKRTGRAGDAVELSAGRSAYSILVITEGPVDATDSTVVDSSLVAGLRAGIAEGAGEFADRFVIETRSVAAREADAGVRTAWEMRDTRAVVTLVAGGSALWTAASAVGVANGVVVLDARDPGTAQAERPDEEVMFRRSREGLSAGLPVFQRDLTYFAPMSVGFPPPFEFFRSWTLRPTSTELGRRLGEALASRSEVRKVAIVLPAHGGNAELAESFWWVAKALGREVEEIGHEPGRRDYAPEAARFVASGAQAILFAGPGEETAEWLASLAARKSNPLLLGTRELDPDGFHARVRGRLENAIIVGNDWEDRDPEQVARMARRDQRTPKTRRGFRAGWILARAVLEGAFTPSHLRVALEERSQRTFGLGGGSGMIVGIRQKAGTKPQDVVVPLFVVRQGSLVPLESP